MKLWEIRALVADCEAATIRSEEALKWLVGKKVQVWPGTEEHWSGAVRAYNDPADRRVAVVADNPESLPSRFDRDNHRRHGHLMVDLSCFKLVK